MAARLKLALQFKRQTVTKTMRIPRDEKPLCALQIDEVFISDTVVGFTRRPGRPRNGARCKNEVAAPQERCPGSVDQSVLASPTGTDHEKKHAHPRHSAYALSSRPISTAGAACMILLVEM